MITAQVWLVRLMTLLPNISEIVFRQKRRLRKKWRYFGAGNSWTFIYFGWLYVIRVLQYIAHLDLVFKKIFSFTLNIFWDKYLLIFKKSSFLWICRGIILSCGNTVLYWNKQWPLYSPSRHSQTLRSLLFDPNPWQLDVVEHSNNVTTLAC